MKAFLKIAITFFGLFFYVNLCSAQIAARVNVKDTVHARMLDSVIVNKWLKASDVSYIADVEGTKIYAGKKTNEVILSNKITGLPLSLGRTALAKIPGLNIWE